MKRPLLLPLVPVYAAGLALRELRLTRGWEPVRRLRHPVISIGNLSTGGSGKTPFVIALAQLLSSRGFQVDVLSRGYGRNGRSAMRVPPLGSADEFGDEPVLLARTTTRGNVGLPVYVAEQRYAAGELAERDFDAMDNADRRRSAIHILDDGFQHRQLARQLDIVLLDRGDWEDRLLPAGNLREPRGALERADVVVIPSDETRLESELRDGGFSNQIWRVRRCMTVPAMHGPVAAFCGIARPGQFFAGLRASGLTLSSETAFPDHYRYSQQDLVRLLHRAHSEGAVAIFTTAKDAVRGPVLEQGPARRIAEKVPFHVVGFHIEFEDESTIAEWLTARLGASRSPASL
jgi:tetraacyldisaccharide 4'-kinase